MSHPDPLLMLADIARVASERPDLGEELVRALYQHLVLIEGRQPAIDELRDYVDRLSSLGRSHLTSQAQPPAERDPLIAALARYVEALHRRYPEGPYFPDLTTSPWSFDVQSISRPTSIWYDPNDTTLPHQHAEWLAAHIQGAELVVTHALGHGSPEDPRADWRRLYSWLVAWTQPSASRSADHATTGSRLARAGFRPCASDVAGL